MTPEARDIRLVKRAAEPVSPDIRFSLVIATVGRVAELQACLRSIAEQTLPPHQVIIVDQNPDSLLTPILPEFEGALPLRHVHALRGASRARNAALPLVTGDVVGFPDDDCVYPPWLLAAMSAEFNRGVDKDGIAICPRNHRGEPFPRFDRRAGAVTRKNVFTRMSMIGLFLRKHVVEAVGAFDERLGPGAGTIWGAGEDVDYPIRALESGFRIEYRPELSVTHSFDKPSNAAIAASLGRSYGAGLGYLIRRHRYPASTAVHRLVVLPIGGMVTSAMRGRWAEVCYYAGTLRGRLTGWWRAG